MRIFKSTTVILPALFLCGVPDSLNAAVITWVGNQSSGHQSEFGSSFFDANYWQNFVVPGIGDTVIFDASQLIPGEGGTNVYFGDFTRHIYPPGATSFNTTFFPGQDAKVSDLLIADGVFKFDLGGRLLEVTDGVAPNDGIVILSNASMNLEGGGTLRSAATQGEKITVRGAATTYDSQGHMLINNMTIKEGATLFSHNHPMYGGFLGIGSSMLVTSGAHLIDSSDFMGIGGDNISGNLTISAGANGLIDDIRTRGNASILVTGNSSRLEVLTIMFLNRGATLTVADGALAVVRSFTSFTGGNGFAGTIVLENGSLTSQQPLEVGVDGLIKGNGTINGQVTNYHGVIAPGESPGTLNIVGDYLQFPGGTLQLEIGGTHPGIDSDLLNVSGNIDLSGMLQVIFRNGYMPQLNDHFDLIKYGSVGNLNPTILISGAPAGFQYSTSLTNGRFTLSVITVPEPVVSTFTLLAIALATSLHRRRECTWH